MQRRAGKGLAEHGQVAPLAAPVVERGLGLWKGSEHRADRAHPADLVVVTEVGHVAPSREPAVVIRLLVDGSGCIGLAGRHRPDGTKHAAAVTGSTGCNPVTACGWAW